MNEKSNEETKVSRRKALGTILGGAAATLAVTSLPTFGNEVDPWISNSVKMGVSQTMWG